MAYIGSSLNVVSVNAGREAASMAKRIVPDGEQVSWVLAFCSGRHDPDEFLNGIRTELGNVNIYGGSACGIITNDMLSHSGYECGLAVFTTPAPVPVLIDDMESGEYSAGEKIALELNNLAEDGDTILIFFDQLKSVQPFRLYAGSSLLNGLYAGLKGKKINVIGAGLVGDFKFYPSFLFSGSEVLEHSVITLIIPGKLTVCSTTLMHGCIPVSSFMEITRMNGPVVYELDGRKATDVFLEMMGTENKSGEDVIIPYSITLGKKYGYRYAPYSEQSYVNSLIVDSNFEDGSIILFETDFQEGTMVQIMTRENRIMLDSARKGTEELLASAGQPELALYIDCAGRTRDFSGSEIEEADVVRKIIGKEIPLLGFYSGMEIAPFQGRSRPLNWTGILTVFNNE